MTGTALAGVAAAISYSHMRQLAQDDGQAGWHAHAFPLSVDGIEIVASLACSPTTATAGDPGGCPGPVLSLPVWSTNSTRLTCRYSRWAVLGLNQ